MRQQPRSASAEPRCYRPPSALGYLTPRGSASACTSGRSTPDSRERCQKDICKALAEKCKSYKLEKESVKRKLGHLEASYERDIATSHVAASLADCQVLNKVLQDEVKKANKLRNHAVNEAKKLAAERRQLVADRKRQALELKMAAMRLAELAKEHATKMRNLSKDHAVEIRDWKKESAKVHADAGSIESLLSAAIQAREAAEARAEVAEAAQEAAEEKLGEAEEELDEALEAVMEAEGEAQEVAAAHSAALSEAAYASMLGARREERAKARVATLEKKLESSMPSTLPRTADGWAALSRQARWKASQRDRAALELLLRSSSFRVGDIKAVLAKLGLQKKLFDTPEIFDIFYERVKELVNKMEEEVFGHSLALYLHYEHHTPLPKLLQFTQAVCKLYDRAADSYKPKPLLKHRYRQEFIKVPRLCPPVSKLVPIIRRIEATLNVKHAENGKIAFVGLMEVIQDMLAHDCGSFDMPALPAFMGGAMKVPVVIQFDGTGFGSLAINTAVVRNPFLPQTSQKLRPIGIGKCKDDKRGTTRLLAENLPIINGWVEKESTGTCSEFTIGETVVDVMPEVFSTTDVAALRHCEHLAASGWCGCDSDFALRTTPKKPEDVSEMHNKCGECVSHKRIPRFVIIHHRGRVCLTRDPRPATPLLITARRRQQNTRSSSRLRRHSRRTSRRQVAPRFQSGACSMLIVT